MTYDMITALALFAFVSSITPGPNNLMLMASGANFGLRRSVPHMLGVSGGFAVMILVVGAGLAQLFQLYPVANTVLTAVSVVYLLYLAWKIATAGPARSEEGSAEQGQGEGQIQGRPFSFLQAAAFQWVNPKAWAMTLTATTVYLPGPALNQETDAPLWALLAVAGVFSAVNLPCIASWVMLGQQMARILTKPRHLTVFNWTMAGLLVLSMAPVVLPAVLAVIASVG